MIPAPSRRGFLAQAGGAAALVLGAASISRAGRRLAFADEAAFLRAVIAGDEGVVLAALQREPALRGVRDEQGRSAVVLAVWHGHVQMAGKMTPSQERDLLEAALLEDWDRCQALADRKPAAVNAAFAFGGTVLYTMARLGRDDMWRMHSMGVDPDHCPPGGQAAAFGAMRCEDLHRGWCAAVDLLGNGASGQVLAQGGRSLLHEAVQRRSVQLARLALRKGAAPGAVDASGETALDLARRLGADELVALLLRPGQVARDYRASRLLGRDGQTMELPDLSDLPEARRREMVGVSHGRAQRVRELLAADQRYAFAISPQDELAIEAGAHMGNTEVMDLLLECGAPMSLPTAISHGDLDHARTLLEQDPDLVDERGAHDFALSWYPSIGGGSVEAAEILLDAGVDLEQQSKGTTVLHWAAMRGQRDLATFLLDEGAELEAVGYKFDLAGQTPLQLARARGQAAMVRLLKSRGARDTG